MDQDGHALELAYRTVSGWLRETSGLMSKTIPRFKDPDTLTALQLKATIEEYDAEIKKFKDVLAGRIKPKITIVEPPLENKSAAYIKAIEETRRKEKEAIESGIKVLKKRRSLYAGKLRPAKIKQFEIGIVIGEADRINKQAEEILARIQELKTAIKEQIQKFTELQAKHNELHGKFQKINLDPNRILPMFNTEIPRHIFDLAKR